MGLKVSAPEVRAAASFLKRRGFSTEQIPPRRFALASKDLDVPFKDTLVYLGEDDAERRNDKGEGSDFEDSEAT